MDYDSIINSTEIKFYQLKKGKLSGYYPNHKKNTIYPSNFITKGSKTETKYYVAMYPQDWKIIN